MLIPPATLETWMLVAAAVSAAVIPRPVQLHDSRAVFLATTLLVYAFPSVSASVGVEAEMISFAAPERIPALQVTAMLAIVAFLGGYIVHGVPRGRSLRVAEMLREMPKTPRFAVLALVSVIPLLVAVANSGPQRILGVAEHARGHGQFDAKVWTDYAFVIAAMIGWPLAVLAAVGLHQHRRWRFVLVPMVVALLPMARFSRGLAIPLGLFAATWAVVNGRLARAQRIAVIGVAVLIVGGGVYLASVMRSTYPTAGLGRYPQFVADVITGGEIKSEPTRGTLASRMTESVEAFSVSTAAVEIHGSRSREWAGYLVVLLPIPSFVLPDSVPVRSANVAVDRGISGSSFPYPMLVEVRLFWGWLGVLGVYFLVGWLSARVDRGLSGVTGARTWGAWLPMVYYCLWCYLFVRSYHSGLRSSTRPVLYFFLAHQFGGLAWRSLAPGAGRWRRGSPRQVSDARAPEARAERKGTPPLPTANSAPLPERDSNTDAQSQAR